jgi:hypothetical protein
MNKLLIAMILTVSTGMIVAQPAFADYDPVGSTLIGGITGAVIGHAVGGRNGAYVGAALGGMSGAVIGSNQRPYYGNSYYQQTAYYPPTPVNYYPTTYYEEREVAYPVHQVIYYGDGDHYRSWHHEWHEHEWHEHGDHHGWHDQGWGDDD